MKRTCINCFGVNWLRVLVFTLGIVGMMVAGTARAQFTGSYQTNIINGTFINWPSDYNIGNNMMDDQLQVINGGSLTCNSNLYVGLNGGNGNSLLIDNGGQVNSGQAEVGVAGTSNNIAIISGNNSSWQCARTLYVGGEYTYGSLLTIEKGARVSSAQGAMRGFGGTVIVQDPGSAWDMGAFWVGYDFGAGNTVIITNGARVTCSDATLGTWYGSASHNAVVVAGSNSVWRNSGSLILGIPGSDNSVTIKDGGFASATNVILGASPISTSNQIVVVGGSLMITSSTANATLDVRQGTVSLSNGLITVDSLIVTNGSTGSFALVGGTLNTKATTINNGSPFTAGDGSRSATLNLQGGTHSFANGLVINTNAVLKGVGTIQANLTLAGTLSPGNSAGAITNFGNLTLQSSALLDMQLGGRAQGNQYDFVLVNGNVILGGQLQLSFINGFASSVSSNDTFVILQGNSPLGGSFINVIDNRVTTMGGEGSFFVDYGNNSVTLSGYQVVPEPSTLSLLLVGIVGLGFWHRRTELRPSS